MKRALLLCCLIHFLCPACNAPAQTTIELEEVRRMLLFFEVKPDSEFTPQQRTLLYESLMAGLSTASDRVALLEYREPAIPEEDQGKSELAAEAGADCWLHVLIEGDFEEARLQIRCLDLINGLTAFELDLQKEILRGTRELGLMFWHELKESVSGYFSRALSLENKFGDLTVQGIPGTRIKGITRKKLVIPEEGTITEILPLPSTVPFRATRRGYWPVEGQIYMDQPQKTIVLEQDPGGRLALDFYLNNFNFPGFDLTYFLVPESLYVKAGVLTFLLGFMLGGDEDSPFLVSETLQHFNLSLGFYFNAPDRYFRPYFTANAFWRIITARGYWGLEPIAPFGLQPIFGFEYARQTRIKLFFEYAPILYWTGDIDDTFLLLLSVPARDEFSGYIPLPWFAINIFNVKLGMRIRL